MQTYIFNPYECYGVSLYENTITNADRDVLTVTLLKIRNVQNNIKQIIRVVKRSTGNVQKSVKQIL